MARIAVAAGKKKSQNHSVPSEVELLITAFGGENVHHVCRGLLSTGDLAVIR